MIHVHWLTIQAKVGETGLIRIDGHNDDDVDDDDYEYNDNDNDNNDNNMIRMIFITITKFSNLIGYQLP